MQQQSIHSITSTTLEEVQKNFQQWRSEKPSHNSHIPNYLWDQVAHIVDHYRQSYILKYLKITKHQLVTAMESRKKSHDMDSIITSTSQLTPDNIVTDQFVKISMPMTFDPQSTQPISQQPISIAPTPSTQEPNLPIIEIIHPNGFIMRITAMPDPQLSTLLSSFMGVA